MGPLAADGAVHENETGPVLPAGSVWMTVDPSLVAAERFRSAGSGTLVISVPLTVVPTNETTVIKPPVAGTNTFHTVPIAVA